MISGIINLAVALILHLAFFVMYAGMKIKTHNNKLIKEMILGSWGIFLFLVFELVAAIIYKHFANYAAFYIIFLMLSALFYFVLIAQKSETN